MDPFSALGAVSAAVQAILTGIQLKQENIRQRALQAAQEAQQKEPTQEEVSEEALFWDELNKKVEKAYAGTAEKIHEKFVEKQGKATKPEDWQRIADELSSDICALQGRVWREIT
jgi:hypothetical protein